MANPFLGEIKICAFNFPPKGWALCNGQLLPINQNQALFSLLGTIYGGDGRVTFSLPDLRSTAPMHAGAGFIQGQRGGEENHTLIQSELPAHSHLVPASNRPGNQASPAGALFAAHRGGYANNSDTSLAPASVSNVGASQPHNNMPPYLVLNFVIALQGIFPSRN